VQCRVPAACSKGSHHAGIYSPAPGGVRRGKQVEVAVACWIIGLVPCRQSQPDSSTSRFLRGRLDCSFDLVLQNSEYLLARPPSNGLGVLYLAPSVKRYDGDTRTRATDSQGLLATLNASTYT
jgi:hypothetical protein